MCLQDIIPTFRFKEVADLSEENQLLIIRNVYRDFGDLLYYWPEIYACVEAYKKILIN